MNPRTLPQRKAGLLWAGPLPRHPDCLPVARTRAGVCQGPLGWAWPTQSPQFSMLIARVTTLAALPGAGGPRSLISPAGAHLPLRASSGHQITLIRPAPFAHRARHQSPEAQWEPRQASGPARLSQGRDVSLALSPWPSLQLSAVQAPLASPPLPTLHSEGVKG